MPVADGSAAEMGWACRGMAGCRQQEGCQRCACVCGHAHGMRDRRGRAGDGAAEADGRVGKGGEERVCSSLGVAREEFDRHGLMTGKL